jgi:uncharacterized RDD family membrane protein YckC
VVFRPRERAARTSIARGVDAIRKLRNGNAANIGWQQGMANWIPAGTVPGLMPAANVGQVAAASVVQLDYSNAPTYAGFWLRFCEWVIDYLIIAGPFFVLDHMIGISRPLPVFLPGNGVRFPPSAFIPVCGVSLMRFVAWWLYFTLMESSERQATVGKMALGLKVTDMAGERISFARANGRLFGKIVSGLILYIGFMMAGWTERKQALHDIMAETLVLKP